jgi:Peptidase S46
MKTRRLLVPVLALVLAAVAFTIVPRADEGFWPYNNIPRAAIKQKYHFDVTDAWLKHLQLATVQFGGGTGSVVSPDGLVLTNHHIGLGSLQAMSNATGKDYVKEGFYAPTYGDEWKVPNMTLQILQSIEDVTAKVNAAVTPGMTPQEAQAARQKVQDAIVSESNSATGLQGRMVALYQGAVFNLYRYKVYNDVRLVFGVEYQTGFYGGDPDNFTYPRYCMDVSMFRLYENGKPAQTPDYLHFSPAGSKEGELIFTTGHPGSTYRLYTMAHLNFLRDVQIPYGIANLEMQERAIQKWSALSPENARQSVQRLFGIQNSLKSSRGQLKGLQDAAWMAKKQQAENALRAALAKDPARQKELGDAWDAIEKSVQAARELDIERNFIANASGLNSQLFTQARALVRAAYNPPAEGAGRGGRGGRGGQGAPAGAAAPGGRGAGQAQINTAQEKSNLTESLTFMKAQLPATSPILKRILGDKTPAERAAELIDHTRIQDPEIRTLLQAGGKATIDASTDPLIVLARSLEADAQAITKRYQDEVTTPRAVAYPKVAQAVFAVYGPNAYPDANSTLRLSYGTVKSYLEDGKKIPAYTNVAGIFQRSAQHNNEMPYTISQRWVDAKSALTAATPFNFVSTNDIVGGNSGSAVVNTKGEIVGLIFDGNIQSLPAYFYYDVAVNRAVSVDSRVITEALRKVYHADALADEIVGKRRVTTN